MTDLIAFASAPTTSAVEGAEGPSGSGRPEATGGDDVGVVCGARAGQADPGQVDPKLARPEVFVRVFEHRRGPGRCAAIRTWVLSTDPDPVRRGTP